MSKPARRKDLDNLAAKLGDIADRIVEVRGVLGREAEVRALMTPPQLAQTLERVAALLTGVTVALERMGGTTLPAFREDIQALRADISRLGTDLVGDAADRIKQEDNPKPAIKAEKRRGRRDKAALDEVQQLGLMDQWRNQLDRDVAEAEAKPKRRPGRPRKDKPAEDTSQKVIDEPAQEVIEE